MNKLTLCILLSIFICSCSELPKAKVEHIEVIDSVKVKNISFIEQTKKPKTLFTHKVVLSKDGVYKEKIIRHHVKGLGLQDGDSIYINN